MTQKYFNLLQVCKQISPEVKERIEELKFGCFVKTSWRYARVISKDYDENWNFKERYRFMDDGENYFTSSLFGIDVIWSLTIAWLVEILGKEYHLCKNDLWGVSFTLPTLCISFESWKELFEQSEETLQKCIDLVSEVYWL